MKTHEQQIEMRREMEDAMWRHFNSPNGVKAEVAHAFAAGWNARDSFKAHPPTGDKSGIITDRCIDELVVCAHQDGGK